MATPPEHRPSFRVEFPDYDPATLPTIPDGFQDASWRNESAPIWFDPARRLALWTDYADPLDREEPCPRFGLYTTGEHGDRLDDVAASDDWSDILAAIREIDAR